MVALSKGEGFNGPESSIAPDAVSRVVARLGGQAIVPGAPVAVGRSLQFGLTVPRPGVAVLAVELKPRSVELTGDSAEVYLREIHAIEDLRAIWAAAPEPRRWQENRTESAKSFVRVGEPPADDHAWSMPVGLGLEIVPEHDPTLLHENEVLSVRVLRDGVPLLGFVVAFVSAGETREHVRLTDDEGRASALLDAPGLWLVRGTDLRRSGAADLKWESAATAMLVEVGTAERPRALAP